MIYILQKIEKRTKKRSNMKKLMIEKILTLFILLSSLLIFNVFADTYVYYKIDLRDYNLKYNIIGNYNQTPVLKQKSNLYLLNLSIEKELNEFVYEIYLPKDIIINYINSNCKTFLETTEGFFIHGFCNNKKPIILIQFSKKTTKKSSEINIALLISILFIIIFIILMRKKHKKSSVKNEKEKGYLDELIKGLNDRQKEILKQVVKKDVYPIELSKTLKLPKSSIHRNLKSLEKKGLIVQERIGKRVKIKLNPMYEEELKKIRF